MALSNMALWTRRIDFSFHGWTVAALFFAAMIVTWTAILGQNARSTTSRCRDGFVATGPRCCAPGQTLVAGHCEGMPADCPSPFVFSSGGCRFLGRTIPLAGGSVTLGPTDWDSAEIDETKTYFARPFSIDQVEVDRESYAQCVAAGHCRTARAETTKPKEPGLPVTDISAAEAQAYCRYKSGRLPTDAEWIFAAAGPQARRFPWGAHGLVCRRASFGLSNGPCARGGMTPELVGMRPEGATPLGILDLAGNVAEWTQSETGRFAVRGGSYKSKSARQLKNWAHGDPGAASDVGFRCVYPKFPESD